MVHGELPVTVMWKGSLWTTLGGKRKESKAKGEPHLLEG